MALPEVHNSRVCEPGTCLLIPRFNGHDNGFFSATEGTEGPEN